MIHGMGTSLPLSSHSRRSPRQEQGGGQEGGQHEAPSPRVIMVWCRGDSKDCKRGRGPFYPTRLVRECIAMWPFQ